MRSDLYEVPFVQAKDCQSLHRGLFSHSFVLDRQLSKPLRTLSCTPSVPIRLSLYGSPTWHWEPDWHGHRREEGQAVPEFHWSANTNWGLVGGCGCWAVSSSSQNGELADRAWYKMTRRSACSGDSPSPRCRSESRSSQVAAESRPKTWGSPYPGSHRLSSVESRVCSLRCCAGSLCWWWVRCSWSSAWWCAGQKWGILGVPWPSRFSACAAWRTASHLRR